MLSYYILISILIFYGLIRYKHRDKYVMNAISVYCLVGLLPINTTYRGIISVETYQFWFLAIGMLFLGMSIRWRFRFHRIVGKNTKLVGLSLILIHIIIAYIALLFVYVYIGPVIVNQELRLKIHPYIAYIIKSIAPLSLLYITHVKFFKNRVALLIVLVLPTVLIGARGVAMIYIFGWIIISANETKKSITQFLGRRGIISAIVSILFVLVSGFYLRHNGSNLSTVSSLMNNYFEGAGNWMIPLLPIFLGLREIIGISNYIFSHEAVNIWTSTPLIFQELVTLLPGEQVAPGRIISGQIFGLGSSVDKGYTPGIIAALYLDGGLLGITFGMFISGAFLSISRSMNTSICVYLGLSFIHLFHRGFVKPEYIFHLLILMFYLYLLNDQNSKHIVRSIT